MDNDKSFLDYLLKPEKGEKKEKLSICPFVMLHIFSKRPFCAATSESCESSNPEFNPLWQHFSHCAIYSYALNSGLKKALNNLIKPQTRPFTESDDVPDGEPFYHPQYNTDVRGEIRRFLDSERERMSRRMTVQYHTRNEMLRNTLPTERDRLTSQESDGLRRRGSRWPIVASLACSALAFLAFIFSLAGAVSISPWFYLFAGGSAVAFWVVLWRKND